MPRNGQEAWDFESFPTIDAHTTDYWIKAGRILHRLLQKAARSEGHDTKQGTGLAADVGANATQFSEAINAPDPFAVGAKSVKASWLPRLINTPEGMAILRFLCALRAHQPTPIPTITAEEIAKRLVGRALAHGPTGIALLREEFGDKSDEVAAIAAEVRS